MSMIMANEMVKRMDELVKLLDELELVMQEKAKEAMKSYLEAEMGVVDPKIQEMEAQVFIEKYFC